MTTTGTQEAAVAVAKGYHPKRVIVQAGYPVRLHCDRQNPSSSYDQLLIPDFAIAVGLALGIMQNAWDPSCRAMTNSFQKKQAYRHINYKLGQLY